MVLASDLLCVALDGKTANDALNLADELGDSVVWYKVGKELFTREGPSVVKALIAKNKKVFLDLKFHDIPNTVAGAVRAACDLGVSLVNVHAMGGKKMMTAAMESVRASGCKNVKLIAVTILTSHSQKDLQDDFGMALPLKDLVLKLAQLTKESGLDGVVCSAEEASLIHKSCGNDFYLATPGIRPENASLGDQVRVVTPTKGLEWGSNLLVVGRPITQDLNPKQSAQKILQEIEAWSFNS